jgi:flagellar hook protein FlgE
MMQSLSTAVSGLNAYSKEISVISNNVANSETDSYKSSSISFSALLSSSLTGTSSSNSVGGGVSVSNVTQNWKSGDIISTESDTDLAINGSGFFIVKDESTGETFYTRNGGYSFDDDGNLVLTDTDEILQGYAIDDDGDLGALKDITVSQDASPASATTSMSTTVNLNSAAEVGGTYESAVTVYDSLGNEHQVTVTYTKTVDNTWTYAISSDDGAVGGNSTGTLTFGTSGALASSTTDDPTFTITGLTGADDLSISWDIYDSSASGYLTNGNLTQYSTDSAFTDKDQNGYASGSLSSISVDENGKVTAHYSNDTTKDLFQIALAQFNSYDGLSTKSGGLYSSTSDSGDAIIGIPGTGRLGSLKTSSLESSNVDLSSQLANLITAERAYQACSKVFTTSDELLQTLIKM